uniref:Uncharacterized protein n=1 Tax=Arundo donax TaxID=35708 RepID=A0A0A9EE54_ARUDO
MITGLSDILKAILTGLCLSHYALKKKIFSLVRLIEPFSYGICGLTKHRAHCVCKGGLQFRMMIRVWFLQLHMVVT